MTRRIAEIFGVAAVYAIAGRLALLMAIPPGYAAAVWPAAGIALAGVLLFGYRVWPGVVLGSFLVNIWTGLDLSGGAAAVTRVDTATASAPARSAASASIASREGKWA